MPPLANSSYEQDRWKIGLAVPEAEVFEALNATDVAITAERSRQVLFSLGIVLGFLLAATAISVRLTATVKAAG